MKLWLAAGYILQGVHAYSSSCSSTFQRIEFAGSEIETVFETKNAGMCCKFCQNSSKCRAWNWYEDSGGKCSLQSEETTPRIGIQGCVSGISKNGIVSKKIAQAFADDQFSKFTAQKFNESAQFQSNVSILSKIYTSSKDLAWHDDPQSWHQQTARIVDHRFTTLAETASFAAEAKRAGVSALMLVQVQKSSACPGSWYNGLQICDHLNGSYPAGDGNLEDWQKMLASIKPMRLMWWANMAYISVQGQIWAEAKADKTSDVGNFFSWNASTADQCFGTNPDGAQGSWGSDGAFKGIQSALASWGSPAYANYLVDAMANSWTKNLGIDGYTIDCIGCYNVGGSSCPKGMLQTQHGDAETAWADIMSRVRATQPQVVGSGEAYGSWEEVMLSNSNMGGQGFAEYHTAMQAAVLNGDASDIEDFASRSGADAASVLCYLHPNFDGQQPGACPTMYFRDMTATLTDIKQHQFWVMLEAGSGIVPQHDFDAATGIWWNVTNDPSGSEQSPLWAFTKYRALNRLALRQKLNITASNTTITASNMAKVSIDVSVEKYDVFPHANCYNGHGGQEIDESPVHGLTIKQCQQRCDDDLKCDCVTYYGNVNDFDNGDCWKRSHCVPALFEKDDATQNFSVFVRSKQPSKDGGALAYLKHDALGPKGDACIIVYNPGAAQNVTVDLSFLPPYLLDGTTSPWNLLTETKSANIPALAVNWTIFMDSGEVKALGGFSLGVFAPRLGKKSSCISDDGYIKNVSSPKSLQDCFLTCLSDDECENILVPFINIQWMEAPPPPTFCTLLGTIKNPASNCISGTATLVSKLIDGRP